MKPDASETSSEHGSYWVRTRRLTGWLMLVWFAVTFGVIYFARELSAFTFFGWPLSFYLVAQGATLVYTVIVAVYALKMRKLDKAFENGGRDVE